MKLKFKFREEFIKELENHWEDNRDWMRREQTYNEKYAQIKDGYLNVWASVEKSATPECTWSMDDIECVELEDEVSVIVNNGVMTMSV